MTAVAHVYPYLHDFMYGSIYMYIVSRSFVYK